MAEDRMLNDEILLGLIKANAGGGGGTTNYNSLSNKPQIAGTELQGNKSLADLGIASASDLAAKQDVLTTGDYVVIENDKISVSKLKQGKLDLYSYEFVTTDASHTPKVKVIKKVNGETISETVYDEFQAASWMTFDNIIRFRYDASDSYKWKYQCLVTSNEHVKDTVISWFWNQTVDYTETFDVGSSAITDLVTKGDMTDALATKANTDMVAADFDATASYTAGNYCVQDGKLYKFKNNHSGAWSASDVDEVKITGELASLKSGLTNVETGKVNKINAEINGLFRNSVLPLVNQQLINTEYNETTERGVIFIGNPATIDALALQTKYGTVTVEDLVRLTNQIPGAPANDGTYHLSVTVSGGTPTYSWMSA